MSMSLKARIQEDRKPALKAKDSLRSSALSLILAAIKQYEVDKRVEVDDSTVIQILEKMLKQRYESAQQYRAGRRPDLAEKEEFEIQLIQSYMPPPLTEQELENLIERVLTELDIHSIKDMSRAMAALRAEVQGRAPMQLVSQKIKEKLK